MSCLPNATYSAPGVLLYSGGGGDVSAAGISTNAVSAATGSVLTLNAGTSETQIQLESNKGGNVTITAGSGAGSITLTAATVDARSSDFTVSSISLQGQVMPVILQGNVNLDKDGLATIETSYIYSTDTFNILANYYGDNRTDQLSTLSVDNLSPSTFQLYGNPGIKVNWVTLGN